MGGGDVGGIAGGDDGSSSLMSLSLSSASLASHSPLFAKAASQTIRGSAQQTPSRPRALVVCVHGVAGDSHAFKTLDRGTLVGQQTHEDADVGTGVYENMMATI